MGVWIETCLVAGLDWVYESHPSWVCGLKLNLLIFLQSGSRVTPFVGVWIETWFTNNTTKNSIMSHPSWVCGLKQWCKGTLFLWNHVTPFVGVWIETDGRLRLALYFRSHPSWVCGLKLVWIYQSVSIYKSHPSWVCGLKPSEGSYTWLLWSVTPFVGVWIETELMF